jgi:hypothetical protein
MRKIVQDVIKCDELRYVFENQLCVDDNKDIGDYADEEYLAEARYRWKLYFEPGTTPYQMRNGDYGRAEQRIAIKELVQIQNFIAKYA